MFIWQKVKATEGFPVGQVTQRELGFSDLLPVVACRLAREERLEVIARS